MNTKKSYFPIRSDRNIQIAVSYPGASPEEMEEGVTAERYRATYKQEHAGFCAALSKKGEARDMWFILDNLLTGGLRGM